jgi:hypothetical protein
MHAFQVQFLPSVDTPRGLLEGTNRLGIQEGVPPWLQRADSYPARERKTGSPDEVWATVKTRFTGRYAKRFSLQVD